jgi:hypothetical protein
VIFYQYLFEYYKVILSIEKGCTWVLSSSLNYEVDMKSIRRRYEEETDLVRQIHIVSITFITEKRLLSHPEIQFCHREINKHA